MNFKNFPTLHNTMSQEYNVSKAVVGALKKLRIIVATKLKDEVLEAEYAEIYLTQGTIKLSFEAMMPILELGGKKRVIFMYLMAYLVDRNTCTFMWNSYTVDACVNFLKQVTGKAPKSSAIRQEFKELQYSHNIFRKVSKDTYMMNPLYMPRNSNDAKNRQLFDAFNRSVVEKGADVFEFMNIIKKKSSIKKA